MNNTLKKKVKCVLQKDPSCSKTKQWTSGPVKIDPLAPVSAIERHLVMKGYGFSITEARNSDSDENDSGNFLRFQLKNSSFIVSDSVMRYDNTNYT